MEVFFNSFLHSWLLSAADSHSCWLGHDAFLPCYSKLLATLCPPLVHFLPSFLHPFCSDQFSLAEALCWPQVAPVAQHTCSLGIPTVFSIYYSSALTPQRSSWAPFHNRFQLFADVSGMWSLEAWKGTGNKEDELSPAELAVLHETSQCLLPLLLLFTGFAFLPVLLHLHVSRLALQSLCWSSYTF